MPEIWFQKCLCGNGRGHENPHTLPGRVYSHITTVETTQIFINSSMEKQSVDFTQWNVTW